jgi:hypothetical protein
MVQNGTEATRIRKKLAASREAAHPTKRCHPE